MPQTHMFWQTWLIGLDSNPDLDSNQVDLDLDLDSRKMGVDLDLDSRCPDLHITDMAREGEARGDKGPAP